MFVACHVKWRDESLDVFYVQSVFCADTVLCEEVVQRCPEESAVDKELQGDWLFGLKKAVDQGGELIALEFCGLLVESLRWAYRNIGERCQLTLLQPGVLTACQ